MPYTINYNDTKNCIMVKVEGELNLELLQKIASDVSRLVEKKGCRYILKDLRQASTTHNVLNIYQMPGAAKEAGLFPACKRALVVGQRASDFHFLETVFRNQGHLVKMFTTIEEAEAWLLEAPK